MRVFVILEQPVHRTTGGLESLPRFKDMAQVYRCQIQMGNFGAPTPKPTYLYSQHANIKEFCRLSKTRAAHTQHSKEVKKHVVKRAESGKRTVTGTSELKKTQRYTTQFAKDVIDVWLGGCEAMGTDCRGCKDAIDLNSFAMPGDATYDMDAQIRLLFSSPIDWQEDADLLDVVHFMLDSGKELASTIDAALLGKLGLTEEQQNMVKAKMSAMMVGISGAPSQTEPEGSSAASASASPAAAAPAAPVAPAAPAVLPTPKSTPELKAPPLPEAPVRRPALLVFPADDDATQKGFCGLSEVQPKTGLLEPVPGPLPPLRVETPCPAVHAPPVRLDSSLSVTTSATTVPDCLEQELDQLYDAAGRAGPTEAPLRAMSSLVHAPSFDDATLPGRVTKARFALDAKVGNLL
ncbi:unnamed protein product [Symbiodinium sp. CCMP2592]|nr:unnamed protein product [Symbiodinium sp. CCMP2592]